MDFIYNHRLIEGRGCQIQAFAAGDDKRNTSALYHNPVSKISRYETVKCVVGANTITSLHSVPLCHLTMSTMDVQLSHLSSIINISPVL